MLRLRVEVLQSGWKPLRLRVVGYDGATSVVLSLASGDVTQAMAPDTWTFSGKPLAIARGPVASI